MDMTNHINKNPTAFCFNLFGFNTTKYIFQKNAIDAFDRKTFDYFIMEYHQKIKLQKKF